MKASYLAEQAQQAEGSLQADFAQPHMVPLQPPPGLQQAPGIKAPHAANNVTDQALKAPPGFSGHCASERLCS